MPICETCGKEFSTYTIINGERVRLNNRRKNCSECVSYYCKHKNEEVSDKKFCFSCKEEIKKGKGIFCYKCKSRKNRLKIKLKAIDYFGGKCSRCGNSVHPAAFEFHHAFGEKNFSISNSCKTWKQVKEELVYCELICSNCHSIHHSLYDEDFIKQTLETMEKYEGIIIENYEFIKDINKEIPNHLTE